MIKKRQETCARADPRQTRAFAFPGPPSRESPFIARSADRLRPRAARPETLFRSIEGFQKDQGLDVDGVMLPNGPTLGRINALLPKARPRRVRSDRRQSPKPAPKTPAGEDDDGPSFADLYKQRLDAGEPQGFGPAFAPFENPRAPVPGLTDGPRVVVAQARQQRPNAAPAPRTQPLPPPPREWTPRPNHREVDPEGFWDALRNDPTLGARTREALDIFSHSEGGAAIDRSDPSVPERNRTFGGITRERFDAAKRAIGRLLQGATAPKDLTHAQRIAILRHILDTDFARAGRCFRDSERGGVELTETQVIDAIGSRPYPGARETAVAIVDIVLRWGSQEARAAIQAAIARTIARLGDQASDHLRQVSGSLFRRADVIGCNTIDGLIGLIDSGAGETLRQEILNGYQAIADRRGDPGDSARVAFLRGLRLPPVGSGP